ncbi:MAG: tetratricopeptide repeat protein, partial [Alphaproteobacteria bacterium]
PMRRKEIVVLLTLATVYMASVLLFYVTERYRLPMLIFMLPLAGAAAPAARDLVRAGAQRRLIAASIGAFLMLGLTLWPRPPADLSAYDWGVAGSIEADRGNYAEALRMIGKGRAIAPEKIGADGMIKEAYAQEQLGHPDQAAQILAQAQKLYPDTGVIPYNIGRMHAAEGQLDEALASFKQAITLTPTYSLSYYAAAMVETHLGRLDEAMSFAKRGLAIAPDDSRLQDVMDQIKAKQKAATPGTEKTP